MINFCINFQQNIYLTTQLEFSPHTLNLYSVLCQEYSKYIEYVVNKIKSFLVKKRLKLEGESHLTDLENINSTINDFVKDLQKQISLEKYEGCLVQGFEEQYLEQISLSDFFEKFNQDFFKIRINFFIKYFYLLTIFFPFQLKALLLPCLTASDAKFRKLGWSPKKNIPDTMKKLIDREKARINPHQYSEGTALVTGAASGLGRSIASYLIKISVSPFQLACHHI